MILSIGFCHIQTKTDKQSVNIVTDRITNIRQKKNILTNIDIEKQTDKHPLQHETNIETNLQTNIQTNIQTNM